MLENSRENALKVLDTVAHEQSLILQRYAFGTLRQLNFSKIQASEALNSFINNTTDELKSGGKLTLVGFGTFTTTNRSARKGRNPQTGQEISIAARKVVKFRAGKELAGSIRL